MAFIVEDGTGLATANALCSVEFADAYFTDRAVAAWTGDAAAKQGALIRATDYVEGRFASRFRGARQYPDTPQALSFPRTGIDASGMVPQGIQKAVAEYALRALSKSLTLDPVTDVSGRALKKVRRKVGPIETETEYSDSTRVTLFQPYPAADMLLVPYLRPAGVLRN